MTEHRLDAAPETVHWGYLDAMLKPHIVVDSGDSVTISTVSGGPQLTPTPSSGFHVPDVLRAIHAKVQPKLGGSHILTGPIAIRGAKAGQVLEVRIKSIELELATGATMPSARRPAPCPTTFQKSASSTSRSIASGWLAECRGAPTSR